MGKCKNDILMSKIGLNKLTNKAVVDFDVLYDMDDCKRINAKNFYDATSGTSYNQWDVPPNMLECDTKKCINSGTLSFASAATAYATYLIDYNAVDFAGGAITFYTTKATGATVTISNESSFTDSNTYTAKAIKTEDGITLWVADLSTIGASTGDGWDASESGGTFVKITLTATSAAVMTLSSIGIFDELLDFAINHLVQIGCLTGIDGSFDLETVEATCFNPSGYDVDGVTSFDRTITGLSASPNYMLLNPLLRRGSAATSFRMNVVERTVVSGGTFGQIELPDADTEQCGRIAAQVNGVCAPHDGWLTRLELGTTALLEEDQFAVVEGSGGGVVIVVNSALIGQTLTINYPKIVNAESYDICTDNLYGVRTRMTYERCYTDGTIYRFVYDNVFVTSFPDAITNDGDQEFSFTISIQKGEDGCFGHVYRILDDYVATT